MEYKQDAFGTRTMELNAITSEDILSKMRKNVDPTSFRVVLLEAADSRHGHDYIIHQIALELNYQGIEPHLINLLRGTSPIPLESLKSSLEKIHPEVIVMAGAAAFKHWPVIKQIKCRKVSLWFDEPFLRAEAFGIVGQLQDAGKCFDTSIYVWDPFWADMMLTKWGVPTKGLDLACLPPEYYRSSVNLSNDAVFIGHLHSPKDINHVRDTLNPLFRKIYETCLFEIETRPDIPDWHSLLEEVVTGMGDGDVRLFRDLHETQPVNLCSLRKTIWMRSKNELRIRMLKRALKVTPVTMFSEMSQLSHANEHEIRGILDGYGKNLTIFDTTGYSSNKLCQLYQYGKIQIQATDPQSVYRGIPLRAFQSAAAGKALLSDTKREWSEAFEYEKEILTYKTEEEFQDKLASSLKDDSLLKSIGDAARERFLRDHTWKRRFEQIQLL